MVTEKKSDNFEKVQEKKQGLDTFEATLALIASIIGGGIISIPYAMTCAGFLNGIYINLITISCLMFCTHLYLKAMDMFGMRSISELCYMCFGKSSVYLINGLLAFVFFGVLVMFLILFAGLGLSLFGSDYQLIKGTPQDNWLNYVLSAKATYIIGLTGMQIPIYLRRSLAELKMQSYILFVAIIATVVVLFVKQFDKTTSQPISFVVDYEFEQLIDSINILLTSYGFVCSLFPILQEMHDNSYKNAMTSVFLSLFFCFSVYALFALLALNIYGSDIKISIFNNFKEDRDMMTIGVQALFVVVFMCNIPYNFFPGKLCVLNVVQEYKNQTFSKALETQIAAKKTEDYEKQEAAAPKEDEIDVCQMTDDFTYNSVVIGYVVLVVIFAIAIDDLSFVFGMFAAFSECLLDFLLPGFIFIAALNYSGKQTFLAKLIAVLFALVGLGYFILGNYYNILKLTR